MKNTDLHGLRVLIVDDAPDMRRLAHVMLEKLGVGHIFESPDGRDALRFLGPAGDRRVDLVMCDWNMPAMNGLQLLDELRKTGSSVPFLIVTSRGDLESVMEAKSSGVTAYILKPYSINQLEARIRAVVQRS